MKKIGVERVKKSATALVDVSGLDKFPLLRGFLCDTQYEPVDGAAPEDREPGTVWLGARDGVLQVILKEPSQGVMCRIQVPSVQSLFKLIEAALGAEGSMWESDPFARGKRRKR